MKPYASTLLLSLAAAGHLFGQSGPSRLPLSGADDSLPVNANSGIVMAVPAEPSVRVIHVATTGDDVYDGLTWQTAKRTVTAGLSAAVSGDQVWVAKGAYLERVTLKAGVALYGGLVGSENSLSQRPAFPRAMSPDPNETTLDGNQAGSVVASSGATAATRMDGFTIRNGKADSGGGIYCDYNSSPTIVNNTITGNTAT